MKIIIDIKEEMDIETTILYLKCIKIDSTHISSIKIEE